MTDLYQSQHTKSALQVLLLTLFRLRRSLFYNAVWNRNRAGTQAKKPVTGSAAMNTDLTILNQYLTKLGVPPRIRTLNDRKRVQKAIYLGQAAGADLGYDYNWYVHGPYSPELANDYYKLSEAILLNEIPGEGNGIPRLKDTYTQTLRSLAPIIEKPKDFPLEQEDWLELVSSVHFLQVKNRKGLDATRAIIAKKKPQLLNYFDQAQEQLRAVNLFH